MAAASMDVDMTGVDVKSAIQVNPFAQPSNYGIGSAAAAAIPSASASLDLYRRRIPPLFVGSIESNANLPIETKLLNAKMRLLPATATDAQRRKTFESALATRMTDLPAGKSAASASTSASTSAAAASAVLAEEVEGNPFLEPLVELARFDPHRLRPALPFEFLLYAFIRADGPEYARTHAERLIGCLRKNVKSLSADKAEYVQDSMTELAYSNQLPFVLLTYKVLERFNRLFGFRTDKDILTYSALVERCYTAEPTADTGIADVAVFSKAAQIFRILAADPIYGLYVASSRSFGPDEPFYRLGALAADVAEIVNADATAANAVSPDSLDISRRISDCVRKAWFAQGIDAFLFPIQNHKSPAYSIKTLIRELRMEYNEPSDATYLTGDEIKLAIKQAQFDAEACIWPTSIAAMPDLKRPAADNETVWSASFRLIRRQMYAFQMARPFLSLEFLLYSFAVADPKNISGMAKRFMDCVAAESSVATLFGWYSSKVRQLNVYQHQLWHILRIFPEIQKSGVENPAGQAAVERCFTKPYADGKNQIGEQARQIFDQLTADPTYGAYLVDSDPFRQKWLPFEGFRTILVRPAAVGAPTDRFMDRMKSCIRTAWNDQPVLKRSVRATNDIFRILDNGDSIVQLFYEFPADFFDSSKLPADVTVSDVRRGINRMVRQAERCVWPAASAVLSSVITVDDANAPPESIGFGGVSGISVAVSSRPVGTAFSATTDRPVVPITATGVLSAKPFLFRRSATAEKNGGRHPLAIGGLF